ncbi:MAG: DoxX family membrane protein [Phycisphaerales bacterium]|nr:DoxX family membrane protein [Phycisphaerales bacterium]
MSLRRRDKLALAFSPVFLRLALGVTFLWAGAGKFLSEKRYTPEECATLASMGVSIPRTASAPQGVTNPGTNQPQPTSAPGTNPALAPTVPIPDPPRSNQPKNRQSKPDKGEAPIRDVASASVSDSEAPIERSLIAYQPDQQTIGLPAAAAITGARQPNKPKPTGTQPSTPTTPSPTTGGGSGSTATPPPAPTTSSASNDYPNGAVMRRLYDLALTMKRAATPGSVKGSSGTFWPSWLSGGSWPVVLAWAAGLTELVAGAFVLLGIFTRFSAFALVCVMLTAMWLTELGPAIQAGKTFFYLVPSREEGEFFSVVVWQRWMWQFALICSAAALVLLGPGPLSIDHGVFTPGEGEGGGGGGGGGGSGGGAGGKGGGKDA